MISCEIFHRELCHVVAGSPNVVDIDFLTQGLHDIGAERMRDRIQEEIDRVDASRYDAVLLGFALCSNGVLGVRARGRPLVIPRAHDCIALFLGSRQGYEEIYHEEPGTYYRTSGWFERDRENLETTVGSMSFLADPEALAREFGEDAARYLAESMGSWKVNYRRVVYIDLGLGNTERYRRESLEEARENGWEYREVRGDLRLLRGLVDGPPWDPGDFLVVEPGEEIARSYDELIMKRASPAGGEGGGTGETRSP